MKNIIVSAMAVSILLLAGCESDSISDPTSGATPNVHKAAPRAYSLPFAQIISDPGKLGNSYVEVVGEVNYTVTLNRDYHEFQIDAKAEVFPLSLAVSWPMRGSSRHLVSLATDGAVVEARYKVRDRIDDAVLAFTFHAADCKLTILKIELVPMGFAVGTTLD